MPYVAKPNPCYMDQFEFYKVIDGRKVYRGNGRLYSWDELHGEIEVFNKQGCLYIEVCKNPICKEERITELLSCVGKYERYRETKDYLK